ncbi:MAG TPA: hypothetical protein PLP34_09880, partial [Chitinophagaceae bacterium]|nr:hypothetical protein [Chitinophagaceae bacterium]
MKKPNEIELELQSLGVDIPSLHTPFEVPENYFSELAPELNIRLLETAFTPLSPYSVPEGYFATFVSSLQHETAL